MFNMTGDLMWSFSPETFEIQWANQACSSLLGMRSGLDARQFWSSQMNFEGTVMAELDRFAAWEGVLELKDPATSSSLNFYLKVIKVENKKDKQLICSAISIEQKKLQEEALLHQAKLASLGKMATSFAHEISNPLSIIIGKVESLQRKSEANLLTNEMFQLELAKVLQTTHRIGRITKSLRSLSRQTQKDPRTRVFLSQIIEESLELCWDRIHHMEVKLLRRVEPHLIAEVRPSEISQILINLLSNSLDAFMGTASRWIEIEAVKCSGQILISIKDNGCGIPPENRDQIMKPFFTTKPAGVGTGLGLSISASLAKEHGGDLWLDTDSRHTRFVLALPDST